MHNKRGGEFYCGGCDTKLEDGGLDYFCPNKQCSYELDKAIAFVKSRQPTSAKQYAEWAYMCIQGDTYHLEEMLEAMIKDGFVDSETEEWNFE